MKWEATYIISRSNFVKVFHSLFFLKVLPISLQVSKCCITPLVCNPFNLQQNPSCWLECENLQKKHFLWSFLSLPTRNNNKKFNPTFAGIGFCMGNPGKNRFHPIKIHGCFVRDLEAECNGFAEKIQAFSGTVDMLVEVWTGREWMV